jgi:DHA1 family tetracycline resistance protein-like MFS transporter
MLPDLTLSQYPLLRPVFLISPIECIGFAMMTTVKSFFAIEMAGCTPFQLGALRSARQSAQVIGAATFGRVSDTVGRRPILLFALLWSAFLPFMVGLWVQDFYQFFLIEFLGGLSGGTGVILCAYVLDVPRNPEHHSQYLGLFGAVTTVGWIVGPGTSSVLLGSGLVGRQGILIIAGILSLVAFILAFIFVKESLPAERRRPFSVLSATPVERSEVSDYEALNKGLILLWISFGFSKFGEFFLYTMYPYLIKDLFGYSDKEFGIILMAFSVIGIIVQGLLFPMSVRIVGPYLTAIIGAVSEGIGLIVLPLATLLPAHCCGLLLFVLGSSLVGAGLPLLLTRFASKRHVGFANGWQTACGNLASLVAPLTSGGLYEYCGGCAFYLAGSSLLVTAAFVLSIRTCCQERCKDADTPFAKEVEPLVSKNAKKMNVDKPREKSHVPFGSVEKSHV